jgi:hypothetical protein
VKASGSVHECYFPQQFSPSHILIITFAWLESHAHTRYYLPPPHRHWMHSEMWWPRLLKQHGEIAWDDYEKDYSDLPEEVLRKHRWACVHACPHGAG